MESLGELNRALGAQRPPVDEHLITASGPLALQLPGGQFGLPLGCWSDRTAAAMCTAQSMVAVGRHDPVDGAPGPAPLCMQRAVCCVSCLFLVATLGGTFAERFLCSLLQRTGSRKGCNSLY